MTRILFAVLLMLSISAMPAQNINLSNGVVFDGEPCLAMNPINPRNMIVTWMGFASLQNALQFKTRATFDGGLTWSPVYVMPHQVAGYTAADPTIDFDAQGNAYLAMIDYNRQAETGGIWVYKSTDGGLTWPVSSQAFNATESGELPMDRPWLSCDRSGGAHDGNLYITTMSANWDPLPNYGFFKRSTDGGQTWSSLRNVDTTGWLIGSMLQKPAPSNCVTGSGKLIITYPSYVPAQSPWPRWLQAISHDGGATFNWSAMFNVTGTGLDSLHKSGLHIAAHPTDSNKLAFCSTANLSGDPDIYLTYSTDAGATWSAFVRVNDDAPGNGISQDLPWVNWSDNGKLIVTWRDRRNGTGSGYRVASDIYCAYSTDNGATFSPAMRLSDVTAAYDSILDESGNDFMGMAAHGDSVFAAWGDVRSGKLNIYFARASLAGGTGVTVLATDGPDELKIFPNPARHVISFELEEALRQDAKVEVISMEGKLLMMETVRGGSKVHSLSAESLSEGIYFISLRSGERTWLGRVEVRKD